MDKQLQTFLKITGYDNVFSDRAVRDFYSYKSALKAFYDECKFYNGLD